MKRAWMTVSISALLIGLGGCSQMQPQSETSVAAAGEPRVTLVDLLDQLDGFLPPAAVEDFDQVLALSEDQLAHFHDQLSRDLIHNRLPHDATFNYIESLLGGFRYHGQTLMARDSLASESGDCMSLAILSTALADAAGVEVGYRLIEEAPVLGLSNSVLVSASHVQTRLIHRSHENDGRQFAYRMSSLTIDFFPDERHYSGRSITRAQFMGMYYRNQAVDALIKQRYQRAYDYAYASLAHDADSAEAINLFAVLFRRIDRPVASESLFRLGLSAQAQTVTLLDNYRRLLSEQGRDAEATQIEQRLLALDARDPIGWLTLGHESMSRKQYRLAHHYYEKAVRQAPFMHQAQFGLAMALLHRGRGGESQLAFKAALDSLYDDSLRKVYKGKYRQPLM